MALTETEIEVEETALLHTHTHHYLPVSVYREVLCFISANLAQFDLLAGCVVTVE